MNRPVLLSACAILAAALLAAAAPRPPQTSVAFTADKGRLRILQNGTQVGTEDFDLSPSGGVWIAHGETTERVQGTEIKSAGELHLNANGSPVRYDWSAQTTQKVSGTVTFQNGTAKTSVTFPGKSPAQQDFAFPSPRVAILDNNLYDQYALLAQLYDWNAKGMQMFPVLIPQDGTPGTISVESTGSDKIKGNEAVGLLVRSADLEIEVYLDARHHLQRLEVPGAKVVVARE